MAEILKLGEGELEKATGGAGGWQQQARGSYMRCGSSIIYTVAGGDMLTGIAARFGVTVPQIEQWNGLGKLEKLHSGQKLTIYPVSIR